MIVATDGGAGHERFVVDCRTVEVRREAIDCRLRFFYRGNTLDDDKLLSGSWKSKQTQSRSDK